MERNTQIYGDPQKIQAFARELANFAGRVRDYDQRISAELRRLGETFSDQDYEKFRRHFEASRQRLKKFEEQVQATVPKLKQDAEALAAAQNIKLD